MMTLGEKLVRLREEKGLSQYEVANRLGIKRPRYNSWEQNIAKPRLEMLKKLAEFYDVKPEYLLGYEPAESATIPEWANGKDKRDFKKMLLEDATVMFDGVPIEGKDRERVMQVLEALFWDAKKESKEKFTNKRYREKSDNKD